MSQPSGNSDRLASWRRQYAPEFVGENPAVLTLLRQLVRIAAAECDTLVTGASGTGKELVARAIHRASSRRAEPFVAINCAAIPKDLMESEIFGHARGAFTGATQRRIGKFEAANGGTLFLDEIGEMEPMLQSKLLRVLQERELTPIGSAQNVKLDLRIIAATNQDLPALCEERLFRADLYYRLNVVQVQLPLLAQRKDDVAHLVQHFLERANARHGRNLAGPNTAAMAALLAHTWPGNVRELHNVVERIAVLKAEDSPIGPADLPGYLQALTDKPVLVPLQEALCGSTEVPPAIEVGDDVARFSLPAGGVDINDMLSRMEIRLTMDALSRSEGNKARAADLLGLKRTTLVERLKKLNLQVPV